MQVFITWSGSASLRVAQWLRDWLPDVLPYVEPWVSADDLRKGTRWTPELWQALRSSEFGILCLVPGAAESPWVSFECGVLACTGSESRVAPFLVGLEPKDLPEPLSLFQCVCADRTDVLRLIQSINDVCEDGALSDEALEASFRTCWPRLRRRLRGLDLSSQPPEPEADETSNLTEIEKDLKERLDLLTVRVLVLLANSPLPREYPLSLAARAGSSERLVRLKLQDLAEWGLVKPFSMGYGTPQYGVTELGMRVVDKLGLAK